MDSSQSRIEKASRLIGQGKLQDAIELLTDPSVVRQNDPVILNMLSLTAYRLKRWDESLKYSLELLKCKPENPDYYNRVGQLYLLLKDLSKAEEYLLSGYSINSTKFNLCFNLGNLYELKNDRVNSLKYFQKALILKPDYRKTYTRLANIHLKNKSLEELLELVQTGRNNLADLGFLYDQALVLLHEQRNRKKILDFYLDIYNAEPENVSNLMNLGYYYEVEYEQEKAFIWYKKAIHFDTIYTPLAFIKYAYHRLTHGLWDEFDLLEKELERCVRIYISSRKIHYRIPVYHLTHFNIPRKLVFESSKKLSLLKKGDIKAFKIDKRKKQKKIRIGYISPRVHKQANMILYCGMFQHHDRANFEIHMYALSKEEDEITELVRNGVDIYKNCSGMNSEEVAKMILKDGIDILYSTAAHLDGMRMEILAYRPAPIIINGQGYNESPGADYIDYCLIDEEIMTKETKSVYLEHLITFSGCALNNSPLPEKDMTILSREEVGLPVNAFVYACLCHPRKLHPDHFRHWAEILRKTRKSIIWFNHHDIPDVKSAIIKAFEQYGVRKDRLFFTGKVDLYRSWKQYPLADLFLDTFYYNSHTVAIESLRKGLPVITLMGKTHNSRYCASILKEAGLGDLICATESDYVSKAVNLSKNPKLLQSYHKQLKSDNINLFNTSKYVKKLEKTFESIWNSYLDGYPCLDLFIK